MSKQEQAADRKAAFHMPGEFEEQECIWLVWPMRPDNWRNNATPAQKKFAEVAFKISQHERVCLCVPSAAEEQRALDMIAEMGPSAHGVKCFIMQYNDCWMRDTGPIFVVDDAQPSTSHDNKRLLAGTDWVFNAWGGLNGGLYHPWDDDDAVASLVLDKFLGGVTRTRIDMVLEGGSICSDGQGTLLTTAECLLNSNRNPSLSKAQIEAQLREHLGVSVIVWLPRGCHGDEDTNGHVDNIAFFARPGEVVLLWCDDETDPMHEISREAEAALLAVRDAMGRQLRIHKIIMPKVSTITDDEANGVRKVHGSAPRLPGTRMPASYANCLLVNGAVILPVFEWDEQANAAAIKRMKEVFPDREIVPIFSREILLGGGNIHCITCHQPKSNLFQSL